MLTKLFSFSIFLFGATGQTPTNENAIDKKTHSLEISVENDLRMDVTHSREEKFQIWKLEFIEKAIEKGYTKDLTEYFIMPAKIEEKAN